MWMTASKDLAWEMSSITTSNVYLCGVGFVGGPIHCCVMTERETRIVVGMFAAGATGSRE